MVSRFKRAIRRLIEEYGSDSDDERSEHKVVVKKFMKVEKSTTCSKSNQAFRHQNSLESSSSSSSSMSDEELAAIKASESRKPSTISQSLSISSGGGSDKAREVDAVGFDFDKTDEELENERVRQFPHVAGQWATFIYLTPRVDGLSTLFRDLATEASLASHSKQKWHLLDEPHVSLSRTVTLRYHEVPCFTAHLKAEIMKSHMTKFTYKFEEVGMFYNDTSSTSFLALKVGLGGDDLGRLTKTIDSCLRCFKLQTFYENPEFHVSFAWSPGRITDDDRELILNSLENKFEESRSECGSNLAQVAKAVHCKSGNRTYLIPL